MKRFKISYAIQIPASLEVEVEAVNIEDAIIKGEELQESNNITGEDFTEWTPDYDLGDGRDAVGIWWEEIMPTKATDGEWDEHN